MHFYTLPELEELNIKGIGNGKSILYIDIGSKLGTNKLRSLTIERARINLETYYDYCFEPYCEDLRNLVLRSTHFSSKTGFCTWIGKLCKSLESLELDKTVLDYIDVRYAREWSFPKLKELRIGRHLSEKFRFPFCPNVQLLSLDEYTDTPAGFCIWISMFKNNLNSLELPDRVFTYSTPPFFPQLQSFVLKRNFQIKKDFFSIFYEWISKHSETLRNLEIICQNEEFFLKSISLCKKLRSIRWHNFPKEPSKELWTLLFNILRVNGYTSEKPLELKTYLGSVEIEKVIFDFIF